MLFFAYLRFADPIFFVICVFAICGPKQFLQTLNFRKSAITYFISYKYSICRSNTNVLKQNFILKTTFRTVLSQSYVVFVEVSRFAISGLAHLINLRIKRNEPKNLRICGLLKMFSCPTLPTLVLSSNSISLYPVNHKTTINTKNDTCIRSRAIY